MKKMTIPSIRTTYDRNGTIDVKFQWDEFVRPHLFAEWINALSSSAVSNFIGSPANRQTLVAVEYVLQGLIMDAIEHGRLWKELDNKWDFDLIEKENPNDILKALI